MSRPPVPALPHAQGKSFLNHIGLGGLDPHHKLDQAGGAVGKLDPQKIIAQVEKKIEGAIHTGERKVKRTVNGVVRQVEGLEHRVEGKVKELVKTGTDELEHLVDEAKGGLQTAAHEVEDAFTKDLDRLVHEALQQVEAGLLHLGEEGAKELLRQALKGFLALAHDAIPDKPKSVRLGPFRFVWHDLDGRLDAMVAFVQHPPHGVDGLMAFAKIVQPDYIIVTIEARAVALVASTNIFGADYEVPISVNDLERIAGKVIDQLAHL